ARGPSREIQPAVAKYGRSTNRAGDTARSPNFLAGVQFIPGHAQRACHYDLLAAAHLPDHRRAEATQEFRAIGPPDRLARAFVERRGRHRDLPYEPAAGAVQGEEDETFVPNAGQEYAVADNDWRRVTWRQGRLPDDVDRRPESGGQGHIIRRSAGAVGAAELSPVRSSGIPSKCRGDQHGKQRIAELEHGPILRACRRFS